jgi:protein tyrosine phosphatase
MVDLASANPADEIVPGMWLGSYRAATDPHWLSQHGIKAVFNCTKDIPFVPDIQRKYRIPVDDNLQPEEIRNLELWSYEIVLKVTREYQTGQPILVHCAAGMQRSAASIAMFLMATRGLTPDEAIKYIQARRPIAFRPGANFRPALDGFYTSYQRDVVPTMATASTFQRAK